MSTKKEVKMVKVIAKHDLSYNDHTGEPQYKRQSSVPFDLDEENVKQFLALGAVELFVDDFDEPAKNETPASPEKKGGKK